MATDDLRLRLRLTLPSGGWLGPGKAELMEGIADTGSISAAARRMGMSYKRAWTLVETLNAMFPEPLIQSARGGPDHGGAVLTGPGQRVLGLYRRAEAQAAAATADQMAELAALAGLDMSGRK